VSFEIKPFAWPKKGFQNLLKKACEREVSFLLYRGLTCLSTHKGFQGNGGKHVQPKCQPSDIDKHIVRGEIVEDVP
jgi:hypothetical protein